MPATQRQSSRKEDERRLAIPKETTIINQDDMKTEDLKITPKWSKSKEDIWNENFEQLEDSPKVIQMQPRRKPLWHYIAAAVAAIAILMPTIAFLYTKSETAGRGTHLAVLLPDG